MAKKAAKPKREVPRSAEPRIYSYIRFSTPEQKMGDSERRQLEMFDRFRESYQGDLAFDDTLIIDRGRSGHHGHHRTKGAFGKFLALVEDGQICHGSMLVVESADRLSREGVAKTLRKIICVLFDKDITLRILSPDEVYEPGCDNTPKFLALILYLQAAYEASRRKAEFGKENWAQKRKLAREQGVVLTKMMPAWLEIVDGKFKPIAEAKRTIRRIFNLYNDGLGVSRITAILNREAEWMPPRLTRSPLKEANKEDAESDTGVWRRSYVQKILIERAVLGEFQAHRKGPDGVRIADGDPFKYYPRIVEEAKFDAAQNRAKKSPKRGGRTGKVSSLFTHMAICGYCGKRMTHVDKGSPPKGGRYLMCNSKGAGLGCKGNVFQYNELENLILDNCIQFDPALVLPNPKRNAELCHSLENRLSSLQEKLDQFKIRVTNCEDEADDETDPVRRANARERLARRIRERDEVQDLVRETGIQLRDARASLVDLGEWQANLAKLRELIDDIDVRYRIRGALREFIERIDVFSRGKYSEETCYGPNVDWESMAQRSIETYAETKGRRSAARKWANSADVVNSGETLAADLVGSKVRWNVDTKSGKRKVDFSSKLFKAFIADLHQRRLSRHGRFVRIWFKSGQKIDLVPDRSIADGMVRGKRPILPADDKAPERSKVGYAPASPAVDELWKAFKERLKRSGQGPEYGLTKVK